MTMFYVFMVHILLLVKIFSRNSEALTSESKEDLQDWVVYLFIVLWLL